MIPKGRGNFPYRDRGRGNILAQHGNKLLIAENIASSSSGGNIPINQNNPLYKEFMKYMANKNQENQPASYASITGNEESEENNITSYEENTYKEVILLLELSDLKREDNPWTLMQRYLDSASYAVTTYKQRGYYETILKASETCEITHFHSNDPNIYNFSKIIIKRLIMPEDWGLSTLKEKDCFLPDKKITIKYNYWDYIDALYRVFLYENAKKKHSWFIKICGEVYKRPIPNWFLQWWMNYGPSLRILPEKFKELYSAWLEVSPKIIEMNEEKLWVDNMGPMNFFVEFSIPWIWKWMPELSKTQQGIPCLRRCSLTKFWDKMIKIDHSTGQVFGQETIFNINEKIKKYQEEKDINQQKDSHSPFKHISWKIQMQKGILSKEEILQSYLEEMKKDLIKNLNDIDARSVNSDVSMASSSKVKDIAGESQDSYEDEDIEEDIETVFDKIKEQFFSKDKSAIVKK